MKRTPEEEWAEKWCPESPDDKLIVARAEICRLRERIAELERQHGEVAHAVGMCHEADGHGCTPADHETVMRHLRWLITRS